MDGAPRSGTTSPASTCWRSSGGMTLSARHQQQLRLATAAVHRLHQQSRRHGGRQRHQDVELERQGKRGNRGSGGNARGEPGGPVEQQDSSTPSNASTPAKPSPQDRGHGVGAGCRRWTAPAMPASWWSSAPEVRHLLWRRSGFRKAS